MVDYRKIRDEKSYIYEFPLEFVRETERAICVTDGDSQFWLPKSQLESEWDGAEVGEIVEVAIPEWLAIEKEMI